MKAKFKQETVGKRNGLSVGRWGGIIASKASIKVLPSTLPSLRSTVQPLNQGIFSDGSNILSPCQPEIDTGFKFAGTGCNNQNSTIGLRSTGNHVLNEITMTGCINDGYIILLRFKFPQSDIDRDTAFTFRFQFIQNPSILERTFAHFLGFLLELLNRTLIDATAFTQVYHD
uniref:Uncharacterized protein n=1 Tax=Glossina austeni TaxID=7395 RepID=A0A1A9VE17_GLOAU